MTIEAKAGGCFCEKSEEKEVLHMTVSYVEPNKEIRMVGGLGPLQMLGVHGGMSWKFEAIDANTTKILHPLSSERIYERRFYRISANR